MLENSSSYTAELQRVTVLTKALENSIDTCHLARKYVKRTALFLREIFVFNRNLGRAQYQITTRNLTLIRNAMRKQQWLNALRNIEKLKKLVCIFMLISNRISSKKRIFVV